VGSYAAVGPDILVEADPVLDVGQDRRDLRLACRIQRALGCQRVEEGVDACLILRSRQAEALIGRVDQSLLRGTLAVDRAAPGETVGDLAERGLYRVIILRGVIVALRPRIFEIAAVGAT
jgi:hypothetical protein